MSSLLNFIESMEAAGIDAQQILLAVKSFEQKNIQNEALKKSVKREQTKNRVRRFRGLSNACNALPELQSVTSPIPSPTPLVPLSLPAPSLTPLIPLTSSQPLNIQAIRNGKIGLSPQDLENFWGEYGKIGSKKKAMQAFEKIKDVEYGEIIAGLRRYENYVKENSGWYHKQHASTWLNSEGWNNEYPSSAKQKATSSRVSNWEEFVNAGK